jgi:hypothetical protein
MARKDVKYYRRRAVSELELALKSESQDVATIHKELARRYLKILDRAEAGAAPWSEINAERVA